MSWLGQVEAKKQQARAEALAQADPWHIRLSQLRGQIGDDGVERISTLGVLDVLEVPQCRRRAGTYRRLAKLMAEAGGWTAVRMRAPTRGGYLEQVRGFARVPRGGMAPSPPVGSAHSPLRQLAAAGQDTA